MNVVIKAGETLTDAGGTVVATAKRDISRYEALRPEYFEWVGVPPQAGEFLDSEYLRPYAERLRASTRPTTD